MYFFLKNFYDFFRDYFRQTFHKIHKTLATRAVMHTIISLNQIRISTVVHISHRLSVDLCLLKAFKNKQNKQKTVGLFDFQFLKIHW